MELRFVFEIQQIKQSFFLIKQITQREPDTNKMEGQEICHFKFKITPTNVVPSAKSKSTHPKSVLIKLGNKQGKCKVIGQPIQMEVQVLYSKAINKYCPIKGIIKVYDINKDGSEMISCVGAFNTEDLLSQNPKVAHLQRDIGPCVVYLTIQVKKLELGAKQNKNDSKQNQPTYSQFLQNKVSIKSDSQEKPSLKNVGQKFIKSPRGSQSQNQQIANPYIIDDSADFIEEAQVSKCSDVSEDLRRNQKQMIGQELVQQRRKNKFLEQKLQKNNIKIQLLRKYLSQKNNDIKSYYQSFRSFTAGLQSDQRGQYIFQMNERKRQISLRYKQNIKFKQIFEQFIAFIIKKMNQYGGVVGNDKTNEDQTQIQKIITKLQTYQSDKKIILDESSKVTSQLTFIKKQMNIKNIQLSAKQSMLKKKAQQIMFLEQKIKKLLEEKKGLQGLNQYLQQRDTQMEMIINSKQNSIQNFKKLLKQNDQQLVILEQKNEQLKKTNHNLQLVVQQMRQENSNLSETIQSYRETFGDLKATKDKALERQIKQCLRWIDQQNRDEQLSLEDTTMQVSENTPVPNFMRSIDQIENMPLEEISLIRREVMSVLKRLDEFVAKNSISGMTQ